MGKLDSVISAADIEALIVAALPGARVQLEDLTGGQDHWSATVVSDAFEGLSRIKQHRLVYEALDVPLRQDGRIHALQLKTLTPAQADL